MRAEEIVAVLAQFHRDVVVPEMDEREARLEARLDQRMEQRESRLEATLKTELRREISQLRVDLPSLIRGAVTPEMDRFEERIGSRIDALRDETLSHFDSVYKRFNNLELEHYALSAAVRRLESRSGSS
jgi:hypothetical protein